MAQLCEFVLDSEVTKKEVLKRPGDMHKAWWKVKILYSIKIRLLRDLISLLPLGTITTPHQQGQLHEFAYVYSEWWLKCQSASSAP